MFRRRVSVLALISFRHIVTFIASDFTLCLEKADMPSCTWYLEQLKAVRVSITFICPLPHSLWISAKLLLLVIRSISLRAS